MKGRKNINTGSLWEQEFIISRYYFLREQGLRYMTNGIGDLIFSGNRNLGFISLGIAIRPALAR